MEITSFILGVCAVIVIMMIVGTSVNLMSFRVLKKDFNNLERNLDSMYNNIYHELESGKEDVKTMEKVLYNYSDSLDQNLRDEMEKLYSYIDSRTDKMSDKIKQDILALQQEISRVERGYKEKINY